MIESIIRFSVSQRLLILLVIGLIAAAGLYCFDKLPIDAVPDITNVQVLVITPAPSLAPLEVERQITFPVETSMAGLPGITQVRSVSKFGLSSVTVVFDDSIGTYFARQLVLERLSQVRQLIPASIGTPQIGPISTGLGEIYQYELHAKPGSGFDLMGLRTLQDWSIRRQLMGLPGVAEVNGFGGEERQYQIRLAQEKLQSFNLSIRDVLEAVERNNANVGGAYIEHANEQYILRGMGLVNSVEDIGNIVIKTGKEAVPIYVDDVADIRVAAAVRQGAMTSDGQGEAVGGIAMMLKDDNSRLVAERVDERIQQIRKTLPAGVELRTFYNRSDLVNRTLSTVQHNLMAGAGLVVLVLILLLGNLRGALLVASVIPLSMLCAVICMVACGVSGNLMSLGAVDFGLIVDGAVVVVENILRRLAERQHEKLNESTETTILKACIEIGRPVVFAVAIIIIVYLPILSLVGIEGKMFRPMALTVVFCLISSLILSLTYIPAAMTFLFKHSISEKESLIIRCAKRLYQPTLNAAIHHGKVIAVAALGLFLIASTMLPFLGAEFMPRLDEGAISLQTTQLPSVSLTQSISALTDVERIVKSFPEVTKVVSRIGRAEVATDPMGVDAADVYVGLKPESQWTSARNRDELISKMKKHLDDEVPTVNIGFMQPIEQRTSELISGVRSDVAIKIFGDDLDELRRTAQRVSQVISHIKGAFDVKVEQTAGLPQFVIKPDRASIARHGMNVEDVNNVVESIVAGIPAGVVYEGEKRFDLVVRFDAANSRDVEAIKRLYVTAPTTGVRVPLPQVAEISLLQGPAQISREDRHRRISIELNVRGRDIASFVKEAQDKIDKDVRLPSGYYMKWGGQFENLQSASKRLAIVVPVSLLLILILLFTTFASVRQALLIYSGIPFAVVGGVFALALRGMPFSISAGVGFIALFGVAVLNGVVLVSYINKLRESGDSLELAVKHGTLVRLRPILMTALVASLGFIPMALSNTAGAEVQRPLATVVIGGLLTSTVLTLFILPSLYLWWGDKQIAQDSSSQPSTNNITQNQN